MRAKEWNWFGEIISDPLSSLLYAAAAERDENNPRGKTVQAWSEGSQYSRKGFGSWSGGKSVVNHSRRMQRHSLLR